MVDAAPDVDLVDKNEDDESLASIRDSLMNSLRTQHIKTICPKARTRIPQFISGRPSLTTNEAIRMRDGNLELTRILLSVTDGNPAICSDLDALEAEMIEQ